MKRELKKLVVVGAAVGMLASSILGASAGSLQSKFDAKWYAEKNPDVVKELGDSEEALWQHYQMYGRKEARMSNSSDVEAQLRRLFNVEEYATLYPDVKDFYGDDAEAMFQHYIAYGLLEARRPSEKVSKSVAVSLKKTIEKAMADAGVEAVPGSIEVVKVITGDIEAPAPDAATGVADAAEVALQQALVKVEEVVTKAVTEAVQEVQAPASTSPSGGGSGSSSSGSGNQNNTALTVTDCNVRLVSANAAAVEAVNFLNNKNILTDVRKSVDLENIVLGTVTTAAQGIDSRIEVAWAPQNPSETKPAKDNADGEFEGTMILTLGEGTAQEVTADITIKSFETLLTNAINNINSNKTNWVIDNTLGGTALSNAVLAAANKEVQKVDARITAEWKDDPEVTAVKVDANASVKGTFKLTIVGYATSKDSNEETVVVKSDDGLLTGLAAAVKAAADTVTAGNVQTVSGDVWKAAVGNAVANCSAVKAIGGIDVSTGGVTYSAPTNTGTGSLGGKVKLTLNGKEKELDINAYTVPQLKIIRVTQVLQGTTDVSADGISVTHGAANTNVEAAVKDLTFKGETWAKKDPAVSFKIDAGTFTYKYGSGSYSAYDASYSGEFSIKVNGSPTALAVKNGSNVWTLDGITEFTVKATAGSGTITGLAGSSQTMSGVTTVGDVKSKMGDVEMTVTCDCGTTEKVKAGVGYWEISVDGTVKEDTDTVSSSSTNVKAKLTKTEGLEFAGHSFNVETLPEISVTIS